MRVDRSCIQKMSLLPGEATYSGPLLNAEVSFNSGGMVRLSFHFLISAWPSANEKPPVRAKLLTAEQTLRDYAWSSYPEYLKPPTRRWPWLRVDRLLGAMRLPKDSAAGRREFERQMEQRRQQEGNAEEWAAIRRGWFFGDEALKAELLAQASERVGAQHFGAERQESGEAKAERLVREELAKLGWTEADLASRRKGHPGMVRIARRLRQETTMTLAWIAARLQMGVRTHASNLLATTPGKGKGKARK